MANWFKNTLASALAFLFLLGSPAFATLTNSNTFTRAGSADFYSALVTATGPDTTATADSNTISNLDGSIEHISAGVKATNQTGTSPTLTLSLIGSYDNATWFTVQGAQGGTAGTTASIATGALSISSASTTNVATGFSTDSFVRTGGLPPYLRIRTVVGGSSTPGWVGVVSAVVIRKSR